MDLQLVAQNDVPRYPMKGRRVRRLARIAALALGVSVAFTLTACVRYAGSSPHPDPVTEPAPEAEQEPAAEAEADAQPKEKESGLDVRFAQHVQGQCPPNAAQLQTGCFHMSGTVWRVTTHMPEGTRVFNVEFHQGGNLTSHDPADSTRGNDNWSQEGNVVSFWFNNRYVVHRAQLLDANRMEGAAENISQTTWSWSAVRVLQQQQQQQQQQPIQYQ